MPLAPHVLCAHDPPSDGNPATVRTPLTAHHGQLRSASLMVPVAPKQTPPCASSVQHRRAMTAAYRLIGPPGVGEVDTQSCPASPSIAGPNAEAASGRKDHTSRRHDVPSRFDTPLGMLDT